MTACFTSTQDTAQYFLCFPLSFTYISILPSSYCIFFFCIVCLSSSGRLAMRFHLYNAAFRQRNQLFLLFLLLFSLYHTSQSTLLLYLTNITQTQDLQCYTQYVMHLDVIYQNIFYLDSFSNLIFLVNTVKSIDSFTVYLWILQ